jgi:hypothetical protein
MTTKFDYQQVIKKVYDEAQNRLRTDATITGDIIIDDINISQTDDSIRIGDGTNLVTATVDGAKTGLDVNVINDIEIEISAADGDNIAISDGTNTLVVEADGSINVNTENLTSATDSVRLGDGTTLTDVTINNELKVKDSDVETELQTLNSSVSDILTNGISSLNTGTEDGTETGTKRIFVNNLRQQILAAHDRQQDIFYADFGTKDQRITQIDYISPVIGANIARKLISYTLVGTRYRRDSIDWSII